MRSIHAVLRHPVSTFDAFQGLLRQFLRVVFQGLVAVSLAKDTDVEEPGSEGPVTPDNNEDN